MALTGLVGQTYLNGRARGVGPPTEPAGLWCEVDGL